MFGLIAWMMIFHSVINKLTLLLYVINYQTSFLGCSLELIVLSVDICSHQWIVHCKQAIMSSWLITSVNWRQVTLGQMIWLLILKAKLIYPFASLLIVIIALLLIFYLVIRITSLLYHWQWRSWISLRGVCISVVNNIKS